LPELFGQPGQIGGIYRRSMTAMDRLHDAGLARTIS
jgi:hypothetical protein